MADKPSDKATAADKLADAAPIPRRSFLLGAGTAVAAGLGPANAQAPAAAAAAAPPSPSRS